MRNSIFEQQYNTTSKMIMQCLTELIIRMLRF
nr:MAG TPA: hypothetical protein [Caudoviricetes sp.]